MGSVEIGDGRVPLPFLYMKATIQWVQIRSFKVEKLRFNWKSTTLERYVSGVAFGF